MAETDNARAAYLAWLKEEVEKWCDKDGRYEAYWNYDDSITPDQILDAYRNYEGLGYPSPRAYLENMVYENADLEEGFFINLFDDLSRASAEVNEGWDAAENVWEDLESIGYNGIDLNLDQLLSQSELRVNVFFGTEKEQDYDMGSIVDAFGNDYRFPLLNLGRLDADTLDNALSYLVNQQGHSVTEVYDSLGTYKGFYDSLGTYKGFSVQSESVFIESVCEEVLENSSEAMSELTALVRMDGQQMLDFMDAIEKGSDSLVLPKDYATIGVFNQWSGCGGVLDIRLEKDAVLPLSMVREFNVEGQTEVAGSYTVDSVYGLVESCWCPKFSYRDGVEANVKEDYGLVAEQMRKSYYGDHEQQPVQSLSETEHSDRALGSVAKESRAAREGLAEDGRGEHTDPER